MSEYQPDSASNSADSRWYECGISPIPRDPAPTPKESEHYAAQQQATQTICVRAVPPGHQRELDPWP